MFDQRFNGLVPIAFREGRVDQLVKGVADAERRCLAKIGAEWGAQRRHGLPAVQVGALIADHGCNLVWRMTLPSLDMPA